MDVFKAASMHTFKEKTRNKTVNNECTILRVEFKILTVEYSFLQRTEGKVVACLLLLLSACNIGSSNDA
jgi:hypothetical protein